MEEGEAAPKMHLPSMHAELTLGPNISATWGRIAFSSLCLTVGFRQQERRRGLVQNTLWAAGSARQVKPLQREERGAVRIAAHHKPQSARGGKRKLQSAIQGAVRIGLPLVSCQSATPRCAVPSAGAPQPALAGPPAPLAHQSPPHSCM